MLQNRLRMKDMPESERPYERLTKYGAGALSNAELLAIIIKTGTRNETSIDIAKRLLNLDKEDEGITFLDGIAIEELQALKGIGKVKAVQIKALIELSKRFSFNGKSDRIAVKSPEDVSKAFMHEMKCLKHEELRVIILNTKNYILRTCTAAVGGLNTSSVEARDIFKEPVKSGAASIILVHNHPSGDPEPSKDDILFTKRISEGGRMLGIKLLDHIIIGRGIFVSLKERNLF